MKTAVLAALAALLAAAAAAAPGDSPLALGTLRIDAPSRLAARAELGRIPAEEGGLLAQRAISREWGASDESTYVEVDVPGYRSEGWAMLLSGLVPGAGHLYAGEASGWLYLLAEAGGWTARAVFDRRADTRHDELLRWVGSPHDAAGSWTFSRYALATSADTLALQQLYANDPDAFFHLVGTDDRYLAGWKEIPGTSREIYQDFETRYQNSLQHRRYAVTGIILTHVVAALDALRAARAHNEPLERNLRIRLKGAITSGGEAMALVLERRF